MIFIQPKEIKISRAEGMAHECVTRVVRTYDEANAMLRAWSATAPKGGCYDKCDFWVTFEDGYQYAGRYDLKHWSEERPDLAGHMRSFVRYLAGEPPAWMNEAQKERFYLQRIEEAKETADAQEWLKTYDVEQPRPANSVMVATNRPGDQAAIYAEETGWDYATALVHCNMD